jgi:hypothetical protein
MRLAARFGVLERLKCYWWPQLMSTRQAPERSQFASVGCPGTRLAPINVV